MKWGILTNSFPTRGKLQQMDKLLPADGKWHSVIETPGTVDVDGVSIRRKTRESMT